ncbi:hypothetical protein PV721_34715 [Streptomyces sp. MB09-01]|uniref:hypothetical protein n=1 Tax=Streptomyces sp. MB09-01 TaxID=3028666 RepID=UPI0029AC434F|nr:hypothetical protein [Streptomyces sp. MB09-01]MDX3539391.1 hypothetical protein [Streptomyces sp. MB09-01]
MRTVCFIGALAVLGALLGWVVGTWPQDRWPRRAPDPAVVVRDVVVTANGQWVVSTSAEETGIPPARDACQPAVRIWLRRLGAAPTGLQIRFFLVSERTQSLTITGVRARAHGHRPAVTRTQISAECPRDYVDFSDHERQWLDVALGANGATTRFGEAGTDERLELELGRGDTIELRLLLDAELPGPAQRWSLDLEFTVEGRKWYLPIAGPPGSFVLAPPLPEGAPTIHVGEGLPGTTTSPSE